MTTFNLTILNVIVAGLLAFINATPSKTDKNPSMDLTSQNSKSETLAGYDSESASVKASLEPKALEAGVGAGISNNKILCLDKQLYDCIDRVYKDIETYAKWVSKISEVIKDPIHDVAGMDDVVYTHMQEVLNTMNKLKDELFISADVDRADFATTGMLRIFFEVFAKIVALDTKKLYDKIENGITNTGNKNYTMSCIKNALKSAIILAYTSLAKYELNGGNLLDPFFKEIYNIDVSFESIKSSCNLSIVADSKVADFIGEKSKNYRDDSDILVEVEACEKKYGCEIEYKGEKTTIKDCMIKARRDNLTDFIANVLSGQTENITLSLLKEKAFMKFHGIESAPLSFGIHPGRLMTLADFFERSFDRNINEMITLIENLVAVDCNFEDDVVEPTGIKD